MFFSTYYRCFYAASLLVLSSLAYGQQDWEDQSLAADFDSLMRAAASLPDDSLVLKSYLLHEAGKIADDVRDLPLAISTTQRALDLRLVDESVTADGVLLSAMNLGIYYNKLNQHRRALSYFGLIIDRAPNRKEGAAWFQVARSYSNIGEFLAGEQAFNRAIQLPPFSESHYLTAYLQQQLGCLHLEKNNTEGGRAAIGPLSKALAYFIQDKDPEGEMLTRNYLGWAYADKGDYPRALEQLEEALRLAPLVDAYNKDYVSIYTNLGVAHRRQGNIETALSNYRRALNIRLNSEDGLEGIGETYSGLSTAFRDAGMADSAVVYGQQALRATIPDYEPKLPADLPDLNLIIEEQPAVLTYLTDLALALAAADNPVAALHAFRRADELLDAMRLQQLLEDTRQYWRADARSLYDQAIATARQAQDPEALFYFLEKARARLLIDELSANRATELLPTDIRQQLTTITQEVRLYPEDPLKLDRFRQFQDSILQAYPNYARQRLGSPPPALQTLPDVLAGRELVEYYVSDSTTIALTYSKSQGFFLTQLVEPAVWRPLLTQYREQLTDPDAKVDPELPLRLYQELLAPLPLTSKHDLVIIPDGELYLLPFSALITERPPVNAPYQQWSWLANAHKVGYGFSSQLLDQARRQQPSGNGKALAIAPVARIASDDQLNPQLELPATLLTVRHLASRFPTDTLINAAASHAAFRESADAYSLLHLGTHAYLDGAGSFLLRGSNNNRYTSNDLLSHQLNAELVVIGACETGLGKQLLGEGVASLGRGFARRGAAGLIMSLWSINDAATADLLNLTYDGLAEGQGPTTALQSAGATYRNNSTNPRFGHPYFWAGLVHYGQDEPLSLVQKASWLVPAALVLFVLFGLLYFLARRRSTRQ